MTRVASCIAVRTTSPWSIRLIATSPRCAKHKSNGLNSVRQPTHRRRLYQASIPGTAFGHTATTHLVADPPQPDVYLRILPEFGGTSWVEEGYLHGVPDLVTEVSGSSVSYDLNLKLDLYEAAKIPEYLVIVLYEQE